MMLFGFLPKEERTHTLREKQDSIKQILEDGVQKDVVFDVKYL